ncbi:hypothetical protein [Nonomuraea lactucae]|uniref:hypothetical protein n=1 Tax=Nonomuraea lactucae TaxID=2249762 RepID=UPI0019626B98|nr:hypothetical protein [Nonomuraea lactucae]
MAEVALDRPVHGDALVWAPGVELGAVGMGVYIPTGPNQVWQLDVTEFETSAGGT